MVPARLEVSKGVLNNLRQEVYFQIKSQHATNVSTIALENSDFLHKVSCEVKFDVVCPHFQRWSGVKAQ